ncbi:MAG: LD-carboxypeptidase [Candidatus Paraimprobicoccus trichonymphae]|uniref:LD-carboxypeptidase n=1 Tax=Candidatus Paraimprobicoccus trichonymphae TaxID=3033793 RepID=A0AA48HZH3_9FIRM|nr:MAG: LD-carboxypeptidase [Candidatus Paraimprobicoccus trichonymphae]
MKFKIKVLAIFFTLFTTISCSNIGVLAFDGEILTPNALKKGDKVCLLTMSRTTPSFRKILYERLPAAINKLESLGFEVKVYEESFTASELGDDTAQLRANLFNKAVKNSEIKAIIAINGGVSAIQTLPYINYEAFRENNKIFVGYSDPTIVMAAIFKKSGVITFHGPMPGALYHLEENLCFDNLFDILMNPKAQTELINIDDNSKFEIFKEGNCDGRVIGGNLWEMQHIMGTPYELEFKDKILFFEEVNEEDPYRINHVLWQMKLGENLNKLKGIIIGTLTSKKGIEGEKELLNAAFKALDDVDIPIIYNFHVGHIPNPLTVPIGANLKIENGKVFVMQPVVQ